MRVRSPACIATPTAGGSCKRASNRSELVGAEERLWLASQLSGVLAAAPIWPAREAGTIQFVQWRARHDVRARCLGPFARSRHARAERRQQLIEFVCRNRSIKRARGDNCASGQQAALARLLACSLSRVQLPPVGPKSRRGDLARKPQATLSVRRARESRLGCLGASSAESSFGLSERRFARG